MYGNLKKNQNALARSAARFRIQMTTGSPPIGPKNLPSCPSSPSPKYLQSNQVSAYRLSPLRTRIYSLCLVLLSRHHIHLSSCLQNQGYPSLQISVQTRKKWRTMMKVNGLSEKEMNLPQYGRNVRLMTTQNTPGPISITSQSKFQESCQVLRADLTLSAAKTRQELLHL